MYLHLEIFGLPSLSGSLMLFNTLLKFVITLKLNLLRLTNYQIRCKHGTKFLQYSIAYLHLQIYNLSIIS